MVEPASRSPSQFTAAEPDLLIGSSSTSARLHSPGALRPLARLAWPVLAEQLLAMLVGFSDTLLAGHYLERQHLAAMTLVSYALWALRDVFALVAIGAAAMTARFIGAGDYETASRVTNQALLVGSLLTAVLMTLAVLFGNPVLNALQLDAESTALAVRYLALLVPVLPLVLIQVVGVACLRAAGDTLTGLAIMLLVNVVNVAVGWALLPGVGPLPALGWDALAIGTCAGHAAGGLALLVVLARGRSGLKLRLRWLSLDRGLVRRMLAIGLPGGVDAMSLTACQLVFLSMINRLGETAAAAHGIAIRLESLAYLPGTAYQVAAATLAGQHLGAGNHRQAKYSVWVATLAACATMSSAGAALYFGADGLVEIFVGAGTRNRQAAATAAPLLRIISLVMPQFALLMVLSGALRGAGDTCWPLAITLAGFLAVRLPAAYFLTQTFQLGIAGAWYAMAADLTVRSLLVTLRFVQGGWQKIEI